MKFIDLAAQQKHIEGQILNAVTTVLKHGHYITGPEVISLERKLEEFCGAKHAISCANGTDALMLFLMAKNVKPGDAVFVPTFTFTATAAVVANIGAQPIFVDVLPDTFNIDVKSLEKAITVARENKLNPVGIIPVDLFGQAADYDAILKFASDNNLWVLSDAAQSFGASYKGKKVGTFGHATTTSFFPAKPLGAYGDGGCIFTDDAGLSQLLISIKEYGKGEHKYDNIRFGFNSRLDTIQAAILLEKLKIFPEEIIKRQKVADRYTAALSNYVTTPKIGEGNASVWAQYTVLLKDKHDRTKIQEALKAQGIPTMVYYQKPLHKQVAYSHFLTAESRLPVSEHIADKVLSLPMHPYLDVSDAYLETIIISILK